MISIVSSWRYLPSRSWPATQQRSQIWTNATDGDIGTRGRAITDGSFHFN